MASKPAQVIEKMVEGRLNKQFFAVSCLEDQAFVKGDKETVAQYTANTAKALGGSIRIVKFLRYEKGEGIEKKVDDFAAEVAAMAK